jgi:hypothetical protein
MVYNNVKITSNKVCCVVACAQSWSLGCLKTTHSLWKRNIQYCAWSSWTHCTCCHSTFETPCKFSLPSASPTLWHCFRIFGYNFVGDSRFSHLSYTRRILDLITLSPLYLDSVLDPLQPVVHWILETLPLSGKVIWTAADRTSPRAV